MALPPIPLLRLLLGLDPLLAVLLALYLLKDLLLGHKLHHNWVGIDHRRAGIRIIMG